MLVPAADISGTVPIGQRIADLGAERGEAAAVVSGNGSISWASLDRQSNRVARALASRGVGNGTFVTIALPNGIDFIVASAACWKLGAVPQPVSAKLPDLELQAIIGLADPPVVLADQALTAARPVCDVATLLGESGDDSPLPVQISPSWKAPTSGGSTGRPKLIVAGQPGVVTQLAAQRWRHEPHGTMVMPGPLYHNGPFISAMTGLFEGSRLILMERFDAEGTLRLVDQHRATWLYTVPTMMSRIWRLSAETRSAYDLSSLRTVWHLAAPCPAWLKEAWIGWLGPDVIWELYAGTEAQARTEISGREWLEHRGSVGTVTYGAMRILGPDGVELPPGEIGEIWMRGPEGAPPSYRYIGAEPRQRDGWESLGDMGWLDEDGYLYLADRATDMILVGGANVYPAEVEAALESHPDIASSAVIGLPDDDLGECVHAIIQAPADLDLDEIRRHLDEQLARYKHPRSYEIATAPLRDDAGKVRRSQLRADRINASAKDGKRPPSSRRP
jgi:bile acid-coenzyme A ligase